MPVKGPCHILSIDGGGIRGVVPATILIELEKRLAAREGGAARPLHEYFQLIAGTSTGGIIAAGLTAPHPQEPGRPAADPAALLGLYEERGPSIFSRNIFDRIREAFSDPRSIVQEKYDADELEIELQRQLGLSRLSQALTGVMLTAYDIERRCAVFMTNVVARTAAGEPQPSDDYYFWQAARATSAAPTYFEPARAKNLTLDRMETLIDGGTFANDPSVAAYIEAQKMGYRPDDITILSIGTGYQNRPFPYRDARHWGPLGWINPTNSAPIISIFMQGQASTAAYQMNCILNCEADRQRYFRFDAELTIGKDDMDDASRTNILALKTLAAQIIEENGAKLDAVADLLVAGRRAG